MANRKDAEYRPRKSRLDRFGSEKQINLSCKRVMLNANDDQLSDLFKRVGLIENATAGQASSSFCSNLMDSQEGEKTGLSHQRASLSQDEIEGLATLLSYTANVLTTEVGVSAVPAIEATRPDVASIGDEQMIAVARDLLSQRDARAKIFATKGFGDPAWYVLLDLYIQKALQKRTSTKRAAITSGMSASTAARLLDKLEAENLICREPYSCDKRVVLVEISEYGSDLIRESLRRLI